MLTLQICEEVHVDEGQHPGGVFEDSDPQVPECNGPGNERSDEGHGQYEQAAEDARDPEDHDGVREAVGDDGHEGGDHDRCH